MNDRKLTAAQCEERERILFGRPYSRESYAMGGIRYFDRIGVAAAKKLLNLGFIDPDDTQNLSPTMGEMIDFCDDGTDRWYLHGYAVSPNRCDCRVTFEGVGSDAPLSAEEALDFMKVFRYADELTAEPGLNAYCWYD